MIIYKLQQEKTNKVYIGYSINDNPNNFGTGKYIKRAVKDFGTTAFNRDVIEVFKEDAALSDVLKRVEHWISKFKSDNPKYGFNETVQELIPQRRRLTKKLQVLLTPSDEDSLNTIIIQKSMENRTKPVAISRYVRQLIVEHIVEETKPEKQLIKNK
jgi:protein subunit release factor A|tara:strand:- start:4944 stop:5414 length:471 start_codon:yes stop_codon:yes gene_type:complete